jgi:hypothetical protein
LLIVIPVELKFLWNTKKARQRHSPAGFDLTSDLLGLLLLAEAVRRHGCSMMMAMAVMAEALHLFFKL